VRERSEGGKVGEGRRAEREDRRCDRSVPGKKVPAFYI